MVSPAAIVIAVVAVFPVLYAIYLSFRDATVTNSGQWTGLSNYGDLLADPDFRTALLNTTLFTIVSVALEFAIGMAMALALHRSFRFRGLARTAVLIPWAFPVVVSALMWRLMLQDQVGIVSWLAHATGLTDQPILSDHTSLLIAAIGVDVWKSTPFIALLLLAGLQTIPQELNEAAIVDGASAVQRFVAITLPQLRPAILVALLFRTLEAWSVYDLFWVMSDRQLTSLSTYVYSGVRVSQLDFARGNAAAVFVFATSIVIALVYLRVFRSGGTGEEA
jgi:trehalose/maltose transport system permease protein